MDSEVKISEKEYKELLAIKAKYLELSKKIDIIYSSDSDDGDLISIGEITAAHFGFL